VHERGAAGKLGKRSALAHGLRREAGEPARVDEPPSQHGERPDGQLDARGLQPFGQLAALGQDRGGVPAALAEPAGERRQLKVGAVEAGRGVQEENALRNRIRRAA
jgi:hypothetical protein